MTNSRSRTLPPPARPLDEQAELPIALDDPRLATPALLVDLDVMEENIAAMSGLAARRGLALRPHVKSHKSTYIADRQLAAGASGICVATVGEAEVMSQHGIADILLAYPIVGERKLGRLRALADAGALTLVADSVEVAEGYSGLASTVGRDLPVLLEIDAGMQRIGVPPADAGTVGAKVAALPGLDVRGILTHAGHSHDAVGQRGIEAVARDEVRAMVRAREDLERAGIEVRVVSAGSTITTPYLSATDGITEVRPGTYVFNDLRTLGRWACTPDRLAVSMLTTVVSRGPGRVTIDAGSKTITTSRTDLHGHGYPRNRPDASFMRLSEEHGVLEVAVDDDSLRVGDRLELMPIHVCVWMDLQHEVYGVSGGRIVRRIAIDAMRRSI